MKGRRLGVTSCGRPPRRSELAAIFSETLLQRASPLLWAAPMSHVVDELLALDVLTLREHTERAGDSFDGKRPVIPS